MAINKKPQQWRTSVSVAVAARLGKSFDRFSPNRMFQLTNSPEWVAFLNQEYDKGTTAKETANLFVSKFFS